MRTKVSGTFPVTRIKKSTEKLTASKSVVAVPAAIASQLDQLVVAAIVGSVVVVLVDGDGATIVGSLGAAGACDSVGSSEQYLGYFVGFCV